jgi:N-acetylglucosaminyldiphosphoundecaprenol N-acetyl-beta-D-mannosaminyltransferase
MNRFDIVLPDGWGIVYGAHLLGIPLPNRQGNGDICPKVFEMCDKEGYSNFLFGCAPGTPEKAAANVKERWSTAKIAGTLHGHWDMLSGTPGTFTKEDMDMMVETINASNADVIHVSLPTPMQQNWVWDVADRLNVPVFITGGSYLDHLGEAVDWYPKWMHTLRLCWLYRLYRDPKRLWKRYSLDLAAYGAQVLREKVAPKKRPPITAS